MKLAEAVVLETSSSNRPGHAPKKSRMLHIMSKLSLLAAEAFRALELRKISA